MLKEIERDDFFLFAAHRESIPLDVDYSHMQVPYTPFESSSEKSLARTSSLEEVMGKRSTLYDDQKPDASDNSMYRPRQLIFSQQNPSFLDCQSNVVNDRHLLHYKEYYEIQDKVKLSVPDGRAVWNP
ncbi:hypothetical protein ACOSQ4_010036 [Xanthoceras sorbifolium]